MWNRGSSHLPGVAAFAVSAWVAVQVWAEPVVAYAFRDQDGGGCALIHVDASKRHFANHRVLVREAACTKAKKVRFSSDGRVVALSNARSKADNLFLLSTKEDGQVQRLRLPGEPDEVRAAGDYFLITCDGDWVVLVHAREGRIEQAWDVERQFVPPGTSPEDALVLPGGLQTIVSFQKDGKRSRRLGNRLGVFQLPSLELSGDLRLPRLHPGCHLAGNRKEQGPGPEVIQVSPRNDALMVSLDLYGGIAFMSLGAALTGGVENLSYESSALDGTWCDAFPDRMTLVDLGGEDYLMVCNAGLAGGTVMLRVADRTRAGAWDTPPGLEAPIYVPHAECIVSVCSGKTKRRTSKQVKKETHPGRELFVFPVGAGSPAGAVPVERVAFDAKITGLAAVDPEASDLIILVAEEEGGDVLLLYSLAERRIVERVPAYGRIVRMESRLL